ncbi:hypothetical protein ACWEN6_14025 [Sphaerisporangium sp. NPDC004334]
MYYDDDPGADLEAIYDARRDADLEQAEMERAGNLIAALRRKGICTHQSWLEYRRPAIYPEQKDLRPGQVACTDMEHCKQVFDSVEDLHADADTKY